MTPPDFQATLEPRRWRGIKRHEFVYEAGALWQVEWCSVTFRGDQVKVKLANRPQVLTYDPDQLTHVLIPTIERDALAILRAHFPNAYVYADTEGVA